MRHILLSCLIASLLVPMAAGCCSFAEKTEEKSQEKSSDKGSSGKTTVFLPGSSGSAGSSAPANAAVPAAPIPVSADSLAGLFGGAPDPAVKFLGIKTLKGEAVSAQYPPGWKTSRDDPSIDYVDGELQLYGKESHAQVWLAMMPRTADLPADRIAFNAKRVAAPGATFDPPVEGRFGAGSYPAKIAKGKATVLKREIEVWYALVDIDPKKTLLVFASLRKDVYPELEAELVAVMRSVKRVGG